MNLGHLYQRNHYDQLRYQRMNQLCEVANHLVRLLQLEFLHYFRRYSRKSELQKAVERANNLEAELAGIKKSEEIRSTREKIATETGIPAHLLTGETEEACKAQAEAIKAFAAPNYPKVKDNGEVSKTSSGNAKADFAEYMTNILKGE